MSLFRQLDQQLTAPGQYFEIEEVAVDGRRMRNWKNAPASLREIFLAGTRFGDRIYLDYQGETLSFEQHRQRVTALAWRLQNDLGISAGDRVAIAMRNYPEWVVAFWALAAIGAVIVPVNAWLTSAELRHVLRDCGATLLFADSQRASAVLPWQHETAVRTLVVARATGLPAGTLDFASLSSPLDAPDRLPDVVIDADDAATIFYTSGTTGMPKGALGTQRNICSASFGAGYLALRALLRAGGSVDDMQRMAAQPQTGLLTVPLFHVTGCVGALLNLYSGGGRLLMMHKWEPGVALELIERERVNFFIGVPTMAWQLLDHPHVARFDLSSLRTIAYGGAPAAPELFRRLQQGIPGASASTGYGITETSSTIAAFAGADYGRHPDAAGAPLPVCELRFVDSRGEDVPAGGLGEIWVRGPGVVAGYWNAPEATAASFSDGWFHTGDLGRLDDDGLLHIVDRIKDMVIRGGENIHCAEIEAALLECPGVKAAAVIGVPHPRLGEEVAAVVQVDAPHAGVEARLREHMAQRLAAFKQPAHYWLRKDELPVSATGKVLKRELKKQIEAAKGSG
jgi:long-chain acyl-CoA synthetase